MNAKEFSGTQKDKKLQMFAKQLKMRLDAEANDWKYLDDKEEKDKNIKKYAGDAMFPEAIKDYMKEVRKLSYEETPDYARYKDQISESLRNYKGSPSGFVELNPKTNKYE